MENIFEGKKNMLVIVAHPDDEIIWMGGTLLRYSQNDWTVLCLCRASDTDRAPKFERVCHYYGARGIIKDVPDDDSLDVQGMTLAAEEVIVSSIKFSDYDAIFTHGSNGEYGHLVHVGVYKAVQRIKKESGSQTPVFCFHYRNDPKRDYQVISRKDPDILINLSSEELAEKKKIVAEMYGYPYGGIDVEYCTNPEAFKKLRVRSEK